VNLLPILGAWTAAAVIAAPPLARRLARRDCACGHQRQAHAHYRAGSDCSLCGCSRLAVAR